MDKYNLNIGDLILYPRGDASDRGIVIDKKQDTETTIYKIYWLDWDGTKPYTTDENNNSISEWQRQRLIKVYPVKETIGFCGNAKY